MKNATQNFFPVTLQSEKCILILNAISDHVVQNGNSNSHISKNTNIRSLENLCRVCFSHIQTVDTQFILKSEGEKMGGFRAIFGVILSNYFH